ncbi:hypothetical protein BGZ51_002021 [Haplosporangium sp. Z 767]|nr:hypothetical protein BGZ51_002021 [Haplosporangium sp. Z 767]
MQITIKTLKQETFKVEVDDSDKVLTIKEKIEKLQGHPVSSQKLIFSGKYILFTIISYTKKWTRLGTPWRNATTLLWNSALNP